MNSRDNACIRISLLVMSISEGSCTPNAELRNGIKAALMKNSARVDGLLESAGLLKQSFVENLLFGTLGTKSATSTFKASGEILLLLKG
jgi:hypothetical protein